MHGLKRLGVTAFTAALVTIRCGGGATGECTASEECPETEDCVYLAADAEYGVCVSPASGPDFPGSLSDFGLVRERELDVLLVVDDSPAIAGCEAQIGAAAARLAEVLLAREPHASLRFGITTTDAGNPLCPDSGASGVMRATSCRARLGDFTRTVDGVEVDVRDACTDACALDELALLPTATAEDPEPRVRPWLEVDPDVGGNLPEGVSLADALRCAAPQGIAGCEFASPLESMYLALARAGEAEEPSHGFIRDGADLLIVVVSAGDECSVSGIGEPIFVDNPVFWGDLQPPGLTPAICWRAGVVCSGAAPVYDDCAAVDLGADGQPTTPEQASLEPLVKYVDFLEDLRGLKQQYDVSAQVALHVVGGVPPGYGEERPILYQDADEPAFQTEHGIGPACEGPGMAAPPPVRLLAVGASSLGEGMPAAASICADDWSGEIERVAGAAAAQPFTPTCFQKCVKDTDPSTPGLDPRCEVSFYSWSDGTRTTIPECVEEGGELVAPFDQPRCHAIRVGDALDPVCAEEGFNLEFELVSTVSDAGGEYRGGCELSPNKAKDCPLL